jgi:tetratricopeptide (TPR) repeat protein
MNALLATAILALLSPNRAPVSLTVNAANGETISGDRIFRVSVKSEDLVTGVELYVGGDLRDKDVSAPYEFTLDTLAESEGDMQLRFRAYTAKGDHAEKSITVHIDNLLTRGIGYHLQEGKVAIQDGNYDAAILSGRRALRIESKSSDARIILVQAYQLKGIYDKAQKYAEDGLGDDPTNEVLGNLLCSVKLKQAFSTMNREGDRKDVLNTIKEAFKTAIDKRRQIVDAALDRAEEPNDDTVVSYVDLALAAQRYGKVINVLSPRIAKDHRRIDLANRLAFAYMRLGRYAEAIQTLASVTKESKPSPYTLTLWALCQAETGDVKASETNLKNAILADDNNLAVVCAQAYLGLKFYRHQVLDQIMQNLNYDEIAGRNAKDRMASRQMLTNALNQLEQNHSGRPEVNFYRAALDNKLEEYSAAEKAFEATVLSDPLIVDAYVEQGNRSLGLAMHANATDEEKSQRFDTAEIYFQAALSARPDSAQALAGLSILAVLQGKYEDGVRWGEAAFKANPQYTAASVALGTAYNQLARNMGKKADDMRKQSRVATTTSAERQQNEMDARKMEAKGSEYQRLARDIPAKLTKLDPRLEGTDLTKPAQAFRYFVTGGRIPLLPLPH